MDLIAFDGAVQDGGHAGTRDDRRTPFGVDTTVSICGKGGHMALRRVIAAASTVLVATGLVLAVGTTPAQASVNPHYILRTLHSGTYHHYIINAHNSNAMNPGGGTPRVGYVYMDSDPAKIPLKHVIGVCDQDADGVAVYMRVYPRSGGYIDYEDDTKHDDPCFTRTLGYSISHFRMLMNGKLSAPLDAPPE